MQRTILTLVLSAALLAASAETAWAIAFCHSVASPGQPVRAEPGWPAGVEELVNDELRTVGWNFVFSECPNDVNQYAFAAKSTDDLNRLIQKLAATEAEGMTIKLALGKEYPAGLLSILKPGNGIPAVLAFGNQVELSAWYFRLPEVEPGVRQFGVSRFTEPPTAMPPTLTIYVENPAVDLTKLVVPGTVKLTSGIPDVEREKRKDDEVLRTVDRLIKHHSQPDSIR